MGSPALLTLHPLNAERYFFTIMFNRAAVKAIVDKAAFTSAGTLHQMQRQGEDDVIVDRLRNVLEIIHVNLYHRT